MTDGPGTQEWVTRIVDAARAADLPPDAPDVVVSYRVVGGGAWHLGARDGAPIAGVGEAPGSDVTFVVDASAVAGLVAGTADLQRLVAAGRVQVVGDVRRLAAARATLDALGAATTA